MVGTGNALFASASWDTRLVPMLEGQRNFRDIGGSRTVGGSLVASREVYRSGELSALTDADLNRLEDLGIRTVVDLRSETEATLHPDRLPVSVTYHTFPIMPGNTEGTAEQFFQTFDPADFPPFEDIYRGLVRNHAAEFRALTKLVADPIARPLVFHCTAGKDRTGVAAALLLSMLDVAWEDVEKDYLDSNTFVGDQAGEVMARWSRALEDRGRQLEPETWERFAYLLRVEPSYLAAARDEMITLSNSVDAYVQNYLCIHADLRETLQEQLLR